MLQFSSLPNVASYIVYLYNTGDILLSKNRSLYYTDIKATLNKFPVSRPPPASISCQQQKF